MAGGVPDPAGFTSAGFERITAEAALGLSGDAGGAGSVKLTVRRQLVKGVPFCEGGCVPLKDRRKRLTGAGGLVKRILRAGRMLTRLQP